MSSRGITVLPPRATCTLNRAAQAMYLKLGFDFEGVLQDEYFVQGRFYDMVLMSILRPATTEG